MLPVTGSGSVIEIGKWATLSPTYFFGSTAQEIRPAWRVPTTFAWCAVPRPECDL